MIKPLYLFLIAFCVACQVASVFVLKVMSTICLFRVVSVAVIISLTLLVVRACVWQFVLKGVALSIANSFNAVTPPLVLIVGWLLLGEQVSVNNLLGLIMISAGIVLVSLGAKQAGQI